MITWKLLVVLFLTIALNYILVLSIPLDISRYIFAVEFAIVAVLMIVYWKWTAEFIRFNLVRYPFVRFFVPKDVSVGKPIIGTLALFAAIFGCMLAFIKPTSMNNQISKTGTYSNLYYHEEAGDLVGEEIKIVLAQNGYQAIVQVSEGWPSKVMVMPAEFDGDYVSIKGDDYNFEGKVTTNGLIGWGHAKNGLMGYYVLRRGCGYWDKPRQTPITVGKEEALIVAGMAALRYYGDENKYRRKLEHVDVIAHRDNGKWIVEYKMKWDLVKKGLKGGSPKYVIDVNSGNIIESIYTQ